MALDKDALRTALLAAFQQGMEDPEWTQEDAAGAMADAIDAFVKGADVTGVVVDVVDVTDTHIGTGTQTGTGQVS